MLTIPELFLRRSPRPRSVTELLVLELGWGEPLALRFAAHEAGIRESAGWTAETIAYLCFLRATAWRWQ